MKTLRLLIATLALAAPLAAKPVVHKPKTGPGATTDYSNLIGTCIVLSGLGVMWGLAITDSERIPQITVTTHF